MTLLLEDQVVFSMLLSLLGHMGMVLGAMSQFIKACMSESQVKHRSVVEGTREQKCSSQHTEKCGN